MFGSYKTTLEHDNSKLLETNTGILKLSNDHKYEILMMKSSSDPSSYLHVILWQFLISKFF